MVNQRFVTLLALTIGLIIVLFLYQSSKNDAADKTLQDATQHTIYIDEVELVVTVAKTQEELHKGLSMVRALPENNGMLFIFADTQRHGIWMKDMEIPIDILWFNNDLELVHIEQGIDPSSYPEIFTPTAEARFVIETNAYFAESNKIQLGDKLLLSQLLIPEDIR